MTIPCASATALACGCIRTNIRYAARGHQPISDAEIVNNSSDKKCDAVYAISLMAFQHTGDGSIKHVSDDTTKSGNNSQRIRDKREIASLNCGINKIETNKRNINSPLHNCIT